MPRYGVDWVELSVLDQFEAVATRKVDEMALAVLAYNLTRAMNIVGTKPLMAALAA
jgi:hypothetical protein